MATVCGIDEAGRGPVLGPLVLAGAIIDDTQISRLQNIGVKDSKLLSPLQRERLFDQIIKIVSGYEILQVPPAIIDEYVLAPTKNNNLNWLEAVKSAEIINKLKPEIAVVDCPSNNITAYSRYLRNKLENKKIHLVCEHKADVTYVICGAASILAKVTRDREVEKLKWEVGMDFGSGYMTDPRTVAFLEQYWDKFDFFRKSWSSWQQYAKNKNQKKLGEW